MNSPFKTSEVNGKSLAAVVAELKNDVGQFLQTRYQMLVAEMKEKAQNLKVALPWMLVTVLLAGVAFLLLTGAAVVLVAIAVGVGWSLLIVGVAYLILASISAWVVYGELKNQGIAPVRTLHVLQEDKVWLQKEARSA
ncbi:MAG TPA: phage holin family protein [Terriglobales bacterium]|nr:phage holin family protein [Terriglobales bacterium]